MHSLKLCHGIELENRLEISESDRESTDGTEIILT